MPYKWPKTLRFLSSTSPFSPKLPPMASHRCSYLIQNTAGGSLQGCPGHSAAWWLHFPQMTAGHHSSVSTLRNSEMTFQLQLNLKSHFIFCDRKETFIMSLSLNWIITFLLAPWIIVYALFLYPALPLSNLITWSQKFYVVSFFQSSGSYRLGEGRYISSLDLNLKTPTWSAQFQHELLFPLYVENKFTSVVNKISTVAQKLQPQLVQPFQVIEVITALMISS